MSHDPLCPYRPEYQGQGATTPYVASIQYATHVDCQCELIAKVREDERDKDLDYRYIAAQAEAQGQRDMLAKCIAAVEEWALENPYEHPSPNRIIAALRALQEKQ